MSDFRCHIDGQRDICGMGLASPSSPDLEAQAPRHLPAVESRTKSSSVTCEKGGRIVHNCGNPLITTDLGQQARLA